MRISQTIAMKKVVGSSPISRFPGARLQSGFPGFGAIVATPDHRDFSQRFAHGLQNHVSMPRLWSTKAGLSWSTLASRSRRRIIRARQPRCYAARPTYSIRAAAVDECAE
jgi:hypothetical protein